MATRSLTALLLLLVAVELASRYQYNEGSVGQTFFLEHDLYPGSKMTLHFTHATPGAPSLPRARANAIPFASAKILEILSLFSIPAESSAAAAVRSTLAECEAPKLPGVAAQHCATSVESMVDYAASSLGTRGIHTETTRLSGGEGAAMLRQAYMVESIMPLPMVGRDMVACHCMSYPYAVFGCRTTTAAVFMVALADTDGTRVEALMECHKDTTPDIFWPTYKKLGITPGTMAVCHFLPQDGKLWMHK